MTLSFEGVDQAHGPTGLSVYTKPGGKLLAHVSTHCATDSTACLATYTLTFAKATGSSLYVEIAKASAWQIWLYDLQFSYCPAA